MRKSLTTLIFRIKSYLSFLLKSTNQHGVHSPFVYDLVTQCFYDKRKNQFDKSLKTICKQNDAGISYSKAKLLHRLLNYLSIKEAVLLETRDHCVEYIVSAGKSVIVHKSLENNPQTDFIYWNITSSIRNIETIDKIICSIHNDSLLLIPEIHKNPENELFWKYLINRSEIRVTIDTYHFGFLFFRSEQAKEDFTIRL